MDIEIDNLGMLLIKRTTEMKKQSCPFIEKSCGDNCPLFGSLTFRKFEHRSLGIMFEGGQLDLCKKIISFDTCYDKR